MPIEPDDAEVTEEVHRSFMLDVHTSVPAVTRDYTPGKQVGTFLPVVKGSVKDADGNNVFELRPEIQNVMVRWERAGGHYDHKPLAAGDHGWLIFSEDSYAHWRATGEISEPGDLTRHSISYPFFLPGAWPDDDPLPDVGGSEGVHIVPAGSFRRFSKAGSTTADFVSLDTKVASMIGDLVNWVKTGVAPSGGGPVTYAAPFTPASTAATSLKSD